MAKGGYPRSGMLNNNRLLCKSRYKEAIRKAKCTAVECVNVKLIDDLIDNDQKNFWKRFNSNFRKRVPQNLVFSNSSSVQDTCHGFGSHFVNNFADSLLMPV